MATRRVPISQDHVTALNLVEVDFYGAKRVEGAWRAYKNHLNASVPEDDEWRDERDRLLADLLFQMSGELKMAIPALEIFRGGYAPKGWAHREQREHALMEFAYQLSQKQNALPMMVIGGGVPPGPVPPPPPD
jgi:hypothetical protein